jgi:hypothetical protein
MPQPLLPGAPQVKLTSQWSLLYHHGIGATVDWRLTGKPHVQEHRSRSLSPYPPQMSHGLTWYCSSARSQIFQWRMASSGMLRRVTHVRTDVSEEHISSISAILLFLLSRRLRLNLPPKLLMFLQESHGVISQKTTSFIVIPEESCLPSYCWKPSIEMSAASGLPGRRLPHVHLRNLAYKNVIFPRK